VFKTIECEQRIEGLVGKGERISGTDGELDKNSFWSASINEPRMTALNRRGVNVYPDNLPWTLFRGKKKCELPVAATEVKHILPRNIRIGKCVPTPGQRITPPNLVRIILHRPLLWAPHEASAQLKAYACANIHLAFIAGSTSHDCGLATHERI